MSSTPKPNKSLPVRRTAPPKTPEEMETYLIGLAYERTEKQIQDGTVSPTTLNYFLRLGGTRAEEELEKLKNENLLLEAKAKNLESQDSMHELFAQAMSMFGVYAGETPLEDVEFDDDED